MSFDWKHLLSPILFYVCHLLVCWLPVCVPRFSPTPKLSLYFKSCWVIDIQFITQAEKGPELQEQIEKHRCAQFPLLLINFALILNKIISHVKPSQDRPGYRITFSPDVDKLSESLYQSYQELERKKANFSGGKYPHRNIFSHGQFPLNLSS